MPCKLAFVVLSVALLAIPEAKAQRFRGGSSGDAEYVARYDQDGDGYLSRDERDAARSRSGTRRNVALAASTTPANPLTPDEVETYADEPLYDPDVLRTLFIEFEYTDWESELEAFYSSDVEVPARITVDGKAYPDVGIHFRGNTSFQWVSPGYKRGLNLSFDFVHDDQRLLGYRTLNLLNSFGDATFLRQVLYLRIANEYYPAPKANFVRVVINGEDWGVYVNVQQFNSDFTREAHDTNEARWRIPGSFNSAGGLEYLGTSESYYRREYDIKNKDEPENWQALIDFTRVLNNTTPDQLIEALTPIFDYDEALRFLAVDNALVNSDGYWSRNSDYSVYRDEDGVFHVTAYDSNEAMSDEGGRRGGGFGGGGFGGGSGGVRLNPLEGSRDSSKPLLSKLLRVPELEARYLGYVRDVAENWLDWERIAPIAEDYRALIADAVAVDEHKLYTTAEFDRDFDGRSTDNAGRSYSSGTTLKSFFDERRAYLLSWLDANAGAIRQ